jgi:DNA polymerase III epsilon subunit family exonuclease
MILQQPLAFVDIETTGTDPSKHEIIEIAAVITRLKDGVLTIIDQFDVKVSPTHIETADPQALRINGYNEADWLFAVSLKEAMKGFSDKTEGAVFVAHNLLFDYGFVERALSTTDIENKLYFQKLDTLSMAFGIIHNNDDISKLSLRALCERYSVDNAKAHSAYADAYATYEVFKKLLHLN